MHDGERYVHNEFLDCTMSGSIRPASSNIFYASESFVLVKKIQEHSLTYPSLSLHSYTVFTPKNAVQCLFKNVYLEFWCILISNLSIILQKIVDIMDGEICAEGN